MQMKPVNMDGVQGYQDRETLPLGNGGYVVRIMGAVEKQNRVGSYLEVSCDIAEGEYKDFFTRDYKAQTGDNKRWRCIKFVNLPNDDGSEKDGWTKSHLKTFMDALEGSNPGYHWDWNEANLKGKLVGGLFREEEYLGRTDNNVYTSVRLASWPTVEKIRTGKFKPLKKKCLKGDAYESPSTPGFTAVDDEELPFD
jgi:hypothetical protein